MAAAAVGDRVSILMNDGAAYLISMPFRSACMVRPPPPSFAAFTRVALGDHHLALLDADGVVHIVEFNEAGTMKEGRYIFRGNCHHVTQIAAGADFTVMLGSDNKILVHGGEGGSKIIGGYGEEVRGVLIAASECYIGVWSDGFLGIIRPDGEQIGGFCCAQTIAQMSMSRDHAVLLADDGTAHATGRNDVGQCNLPDLEENVKVSEVAAGRMHSALLRSNGTAAACGSNARGQCNIPPLSEGVTYTGVAAGAMYTIWSRSDGTIEARGVAADNTAVRLRAPGTGVAFAAASPPSMLLQAKLEDFAVSFLTMSGEECFRTAVSSDTTLKTIWRDLNTAKIMGQFGRGCGRIDAVLPGGRLLTDAWTRGYTVANAFHSDDCTRDA